MVSFFLTVALPCVYVYYTYLIPDGARRQAAAEEQIFAGRLADGLGLSGAARLHRTSTRAEAASAPASCYARLCMPQGPQPRRQTVSPPLPVRAREFGEVPTPDPLLRWHASIPRRG